MPDLKITELAAYTSASPSDVFPIVDITTNTTKKITYSDLLSLPHGAFSSASTQTCVSTSASKAITFSDIETAHDVAMLAGTASGSSRVSITKTGAYLITFSAVGKSTSPGAVLNIWLKVNGVDIDRSNTLSRFVGSANERIITVTFIYEFYEGDYFELAMHSDTNGTNIVATGSATGPPVIPACPSIILTANKIAIY
jgi:hypothetical protein